MTSLNYSTLQVKDSENSFTQSQCRKQLSKLYGKFGITSRLYVTIRLLTTPLFEVEEYVPKSGKILDIGCGSGIFSNILCMMSRDRSVVGFDISQNRISMARNATENSEQLSFYVADAHNFNLAGYSIITAIDLLHHMPYDKQEHLLRRIYLNLNVPGQFILKDLSKAPYWKYLIHYVQDSLSYRSKLFFSCSENMKELLNRIGFSVSTIPLHFSRLNPHVLYVCQKS